MWGKVTAVHVFGWRNSIEAKFGGASDLLQGSEFSATRLILPTYFSFTPSLLFVIKPLFFATFPTEVEKSCGRTCLRLRHIKQDRVRARSGDRRMSGGAENIRTFTKLVSCSSAAKGCFQMYIFNYKTISVRHQFHRTLARPALFISAIVEHQ